MQRYPENTAATIDDFRNSEWKAAIGSSKRENYHSMWDSLSDAARAALEAGNASQAKVLWLMADACSMMLKPSSANEPFKPIMVMEGRRTSLPEDFQEQDVHLLAQISEEVDNPWLQARLADLVWLLAHPRSPKHALIAIDAYRKIPLDVETWIQDDGQECWERAISLCRTLQAGAGERIKEIEGSVIAAFNAATDGDGFLALWLSDLLLANRLGNNSKIEVAEKLQMLARAFDGKRELRRAREFFVASAKWFKRAGDQAKAAEMTVCVAEGWVKEATAHTSQMVAASFYESAIQTYRAVPRTERVIHKIEERIAELHLHLSAAGERSLDEMGRITSPAMDITEMVQEARDAVRGKDATEALLALTHTFEGFKRKQLRELAEEILKEHPLQALLSATHISRDGRVIAKRPGMDLGDEEFQANVWAEMIRYFGMELGLVVQGRILPALEAVILEHRLRESYFVSLSHRSPIVPRGRAQLFGRALFAGYDRDFGGALHLLVPQVENMVRAHLKAAGVKTTHLDRDGIENEMGLSTLMDFPETEQIFGEDVAFEIKALFCDPLGPNLRNELAHGLLDDEHCNTVYSVYAWWLGLKLVFLTFWNSHRRTGAPEVQAGEEGNGDIPQQEVTPSASKD